VRAQVAPRFFEEAKRAYAKLAGPLAILAERIRSAPELPMEEFKASRWCSDLLSRHGFAVEHPAYGLDTAFSAERGDGPFTVTICAEYDALPGVGHACGHHLIAAASLGAGMVLASLSDSLGLRVRVLGTPGEEGAGGKILMLRAGAFDGSRLAMMVHPGPADAAGMRARAVSQLRARFRGREAHASAAPHLGRNALDAQMLAATAIAFLRQHLPPGAQVHGVITAGGDAPNVVPGFTESHYMVRADTEAVLGSVKARVKACFKGAALATGTKLEMEQVSPDYSDFRFLRSLVRDVVEAATLDPINRHLSADPQRWMAASTDMANVSKRVPAIHPVLAIDCKGAYPHDPAFGAACSGTEAARFIRDATLLMSYVAMKRAAAFNAVAGTRAAGNPQPR
jgi:amidohydrolase